MLPAVIVAAFPPGPSGAAGGPASAPLAPADGALFGAAVPAGPGQGAYQAVTDLETKLGRRLAIDRYDRPFGTAFPDGREQWDVTAGRIPMVSWGPVATGEVNAGRWDTQIRLRARGIREFGQPVLVDWFADAATARNAPEAGSPEQWIAAWKRVRRIFTEESARNAVWVWCADAADFAGPTADQWYPGDDAVDWACADGYNLRHPARPDTAARSFADLFSAFAGWGASHDKPLMVGRFGSAEDAPGDKAAWVDAARSALEGPLSGIDAVVYDSAQEQPVTDGSYDWRMDTAEGSLAAFTEMGRDPWFAPAVEATLPDTVIDSGPERTVASREAAFTFSASGHPSGFECHVDRAPWAACPSPHTLSGLPDGRHVFEVRALGAGSQPDPTPARREWMVDTTGPEVTLTSPKDKATDAKPGAEITATFSEPVDAASIADATFSVVVEATGAPVTGKVSYDPATRRARLRPDRALLPLVAYRAAVKAGVKDLVGNVMAKDHEWSFTTTADRTPPSPPETPAPAPAPSPPPGPDPPQKPGR